MKHLMRKTHSGKRPAAVVAGALCAAILLTGTLAWRSISQTARNEIVVVANPGGRLHDDFDGENKDIYVENFFTANEGGQAIFARVRLDEYMETGADAGINWTATDRKATPLVTGANINDVTTWKTHIPENSTDPFHAYWEWTIGGSTVFMPTFNKNKDSLSADVNGTWAGTVAGDTVHFDDYKTYSVGDTETADAYYDADDNADDEYLTTNTGTADGAGGTINTNYTAVSETHTAKATHTATIMTMKQWADNGSQLGDFWVWDTDGWAYWANPILPGEATGLLLDGIKFIGSTDGGNCYYSINVVAQFATADDWGDEADKENSTAASGFYIDGMTDEALALLNKAAASVTGASAEAASYSMRELTAEPTVEPTVEPSVEPTVEPTTEASEEPDAEASETDGMEASAEPEAEPSDEPTAEVSTEPSVETSEEPAAEPSEEPAVETAAEPTVEPTEDASEETSEETPEETVEMPSDEQTPEPDTASEEAAQ